MSPLRTLEKDLHLHWLSICDPEIERMVNDSRSARKAKGDEASSLKKKTRDGKNESSGSGSTSGSGDTSGLRRSTRETPSKKQNDNAIPVSVRKSQRLENRTAPTMPSAKKKAEKPIPLRRSGRENKFQSPSSRMSEKALTSKVGLKQKSSKSLTLKEKEKDNTLKEIAEESNGVAQQGKQNPRVGAKRKKRLSARRYKDMFTPVKKKSKVSDSAKKRMLENCDEDGGHRECKSDEEEQEEISDGEKLKENGSKNLDVDTGGSNSDSKKEVCIEKHYGSKVVKLQPSMSADIPMSSPVTEAGKNEANDMEVNCSIREKIDNQEDHMTSNELSNDSNCSGCTPQATTLGAPDVGSEDAQTCSEDIVPSISACKMISLTKKCTKCFRRRRLEYNALEQELCCCVSNLMNNLDLMSVSKDRGECGSFPTTQSAEKHGQNMGQSKPSVDGEQGTCFTCKSPGLLLHCSGKGCTRSYHASCLSNPEEKFFLPMWYCPECTKRRLTLGVYSVSEGIESIWKVREVDSSNSTDVKKQKQYLVKYKGLAHIHNHWVPEMQLRHEVPELLANFGDKKEGIQWKLEWVVPHRLLKKRLVITDDSDKHSDLVAGIVSSGQCEWLVKWCGLDYNQATWEFENSSCFKAPDVQRLINEYEARRERARTPLRRGDEIQEKRKGSHVKVGKLSGTGSFGADSYMNSVNKLREYYHKRQNAVLLDEQDRIVKAVYLVSSIVVNICRPILIISPCTFLSFWEAEFLRLAASINVVVYGGSTDSRNIIRSLEFYEGGNMMLQVLLSSVEAVSEDLNMVKGIQWEAVIVDDCQQSCAMGHCSSIKNLDTNWRLVLLNAELKDNVADYANILSLLESGDTSDQNSRLMVDSSENIKILKERLSSFFSCARFLEYWVPVQISNLQLEQYCSLILSNSTALLSCSKSDPVGSLRDILISTRKCCDHPYIVDSSLQESLISGLTAPTPAAVLDLGTRASGKLTLLDEILSELKNQELKVLILFQSVGGSGRDSKGDILDDFLRMRFGSDCYERVDGGCLSSKKLAALNKFNKEKQRSFFLLETRACLPSIKLSKVDAVIIFDSDWNPINDMRALQKITIDSKLEKIKVFRLYCSCTVEEKVLILAKNDMILDSTLQGISPSISHTLLMWGSSYMFTKLDEFHCDNAADCRDNIVPGYSFLKCVCKEILSVVQRHETANSCMYISVARQNGGGYLKNTSLIGEQKIQLEDGVPPHLFWMKLLEGKQPQWRYLSGSSQRNRKRVHYHEVEDQGDEATKKSRKTERIKMDSSFHQAGTYMEKSNTGKKDFQENFGSAMTNNLESMTNTNVTSHNNDAIALPTMVNDVPGAPHVNLVKPDDRKILYNEQWCLFQLLKPAISRLCETLQVKDDTKRLAEQFLAYVLKNHRVMAEPEAILQAFQIAVCWTAAEALNQKIDHKKSLEVARENINFNCRDEEAEAIYSKTKIFMKIFLRRPDSFKISISSNEPLSATNGISKGSGEHGVGLEGSPVLDDFDEQILSLVQITDNNVILRYIKKVRKKCDRQLERLKDKQSKELENFEKECDEERAELEKKYKMESAIIRSIHGKSSVGIDKLKLVDKNCAKEREELELQISIRRKELEARQQTERDEEQKRTAKLLKHVKSLAQSEILDSPPSENGKQLQAAELSDLEHSNAGTSPTKKHLVKHNSDRETSGIPEPESDTTPTVSEVAKIQENSVTSELSCLVTDEQRVNHQNNASINPSNDVRSFMEARLNNVAEELSCHVDLPTAQAVPIAETVVDTPTGEMEKNNNQMGPLELDRSTVLETNLGDQASISLLTEPLPSPCISVTEQPAADTASEAPSVSQGIRDESCQSLSGGADEQVLHVSGRHYISPQGETSLLCSDPMQPIVSPIAGVRNLPATESSLSESVVAPLHADDHTRIATCRVDNQSRDIPISVQGTVAPMLREGSVTNLCETVSRSLLLAVDHTVNANLGQFQTNTSTTSGTFPARASRPNPQVPIYSISRSPDPLQNELERLCKEIDEVINIHEEMKLRLKSECDKEIEEIVAQIRKKYDEKIKEAEASFSLKRNELAMNQNKVMMHKILAEAFRSKCMDYRAASGMQQAISVSMEHVSQLQPAARPTSTSSSGLFSAILPAVSSHGATSHSRAIHPSSAIASCPAGRSPHINPLAPTSGLQVRSALHAPAPHLQSFKSASVPVSSSYIPVSCGEPVQQTPPGDSLASSSASPLLPRPPQLEVAPPAIVNSHDGFHQARCTGSTSALLSLSATELLMEKGMQNEGNVCHLSSSSPSLSAIVQNSRSLDTPQFETAANQQMSSSSLGAENNVVCLSDDE